MTHWLFQANPKHFDIDQALGELDSITWRVPQYTESIRVGDTVLIWRSGKNSGAIGVGRIQSEPHLAAVPLPELRFVSADSQGAAETRVVMSVRRIDHCPKTSWQNNPMLREHKIIRAPMGTVFPLTVDEWGEAITLAGSPELPKAKPVSISESSLPPVFSWQDRKNDVYPLPGGYEGYFDSLRRIVEHVVTATPTQDELTAWLQQGLGLSATSARLSNSFLRRTGLLTNRGPHLSLGAAAQAFSSDDDSNGVIAQIHGRVKFIGEMLAELELAPLNSDQLLDVANCL